MDCRFLLLLFNIISFFFFFGHTGALLYVSFTVVGASRGHSRVVVYRLLIAVASLVAEYRLWGMQASVVSAPWLQSTGSIVVAHRCSCSVACGILPDQGSNPHLPHQQTDSLPLSYQRSPEIYIFQMLAYEIRRGPMFEIFYFIRS